MAVVELSAGPIEYENTGGPGRAVVLLHVLATQLRAFLSD